MIVQAKRFCHKRQTKRHQIVLLFSTTSSCFIIDGVGYAVGDKVLSKLLRYCLSSLGTECGVFDSAKTFLLLFYKSKCLDI